MEWWIAFWVLLWLLPSLWVGHYATTKGYNNLKYFLFSLITHPVVPAWLLLSYPPLLRKCPHCEKTIGEDETQCRYCNKDIPAVQPRVCPRCSRRVGQLANRCTECGVSLG